jgi:hypothetical protein
MIVPSFWAEGRAQQRSQGKQVTIRRFGWSDQSQLDAQAMADRRAAEALVRFNAGEQLMRREPKLAYNGAEGTPIREEVIERRGDQVLTRNGYGALCLNSPNALFVDIDLDSKPAALPRAGVLFPVAFGIVGTYLLHSLVAGLGIFILLLAFTFGVSRLAHRRQVGDINTRKQAAQARVASFAAAHPGWHMRLYETPNGLRVLVCNRLFEPTEAAVRECFDALGCDPVYVTMCLRQQCFRARVSPKPWRIGISRHITPHRGSWPVRAESLPSRHAWVAAYENAAQAYSSCRFIGEMGDGRTATELEAVIDWHDALCHARSTKPMA